MLKNKVWVIIPGSWVPVHLHNQEADDVIKAV